MTGKTRLPFLVEGVARAWGVEPARVRVAEGTFTGPDGRTMAFGDAVRALGPAPKPATRFALGAFAFQEHL